MMPSLRKLTFNSSNIVPKMGKDLTVFTSSPLNQTFEIISDASMDCKNILMPSVLLEFALDKESSDESDSPPTRKRQRLDHLSQEEKVMRRKMKNRVAAQSARDRKKAKMTELEELVLELEDQKKYLLVENTELRIKNQKLEVQNADLKLRLSHSSSVVSEEKKECSTKEEVPRCKNPAVSDIPVTEEGRSLEYAEGTGSASSCPLDDAIHLFTCNSETDEFLDMLQLCGDSLLQCDLNGSQLENIEGGKLETAEPMVGSTSESLESIKELIHSDHIYHKKDASLSSDECLAQSILSPSRTSELIPKDSISTQKQLSTTITIENSSFEIPIVQIDDTDEACEIVNSVSTLGEKEKSFCFKTSLPSPSSSDAGYDSSSSAVSLCSDAYSSSTSETFVDNDPWDDTFTELFPSLV